MLSDDEKQLLADRVLGGASPSALMVRAVESIIAAREAGHAAEVERLRSDFVVLRATADVQEAAIDRVRKRHPRGDEEASILAPGLWCPTCGRERTDNGYGGCPDRQALTEAKP